MNREPRRSLFGRKECYCGINRSTQLRGSGRLLPDYSSTLHPLQKAWLLKCRLITLYNSLIPPSVRECWNIYSESTRHPNLISGNIWENLRTFYEIYVLRYSIFAIYSIKIALWSTHIHDINPTLLIADNVFRVIMSYETSNICLKTCVINLGHEVGIQLYLSHWALLLARQPAYKSPLNASPVNSTVWNTLQRIVLQLPILFIK